MQNSNKTCGQAIVEALEREQVSLVFGLPGSHVLQIYDALYDCPSITHITVKHENNAALMADMVGRLTGRPGVCLVTAGPGATNSLSGVAQAYNAASPLVHLSGTVSLEEGKNAFHGVDKADFLYKAFTDVTKWSVRVERPEDIPAILARAFKITVSGRPGPVHIEIPPDFQETTALPIPSYEPQGPQIQPLDEALADDIVARLQAAQAPLLCVDVGVLRAHAWPLLRRLAEHYSIPVTHTWDAAGMIPDDHPLCLGHFYLWWPTPLATDFIRAADLVLAVGLRPGTGPADFLGQTAEGELIVIGFEEPDDTALVPGATLQAIAHSGLSLEALWTRLERMPARKSDARLSHIAEMRRLIRQELDEQLDRHRTAQPIHFGYAVKTLAELLDQDAIVVSDIGNSAAWLPVYLRHSEPSSLMLPGRWGAMGFGLPGAIAAKLLYPERQVVGITGDGAFLMASSDFGTAVDYHANVVIVILDDHQYGMIYKMQQETYQRTYATPIGMPDFVRYAESFGAQGIRVESLAQLRPAMEQALRAEVPVIVDVIAGHDHPYPSLQEAYQKAAQTC